MDYKKFVAKYFKGDRVSEIQRNLTPRKYRQLFGQLSKRQMDIIPIRVHVALWSQPARVVERHVYWSTNWPHFCYLKM